jgi:group II intron reverse transcriptase/maturase
LPLYQYGNRRCKYHWVIEGDIEGCFDNIDHGILMQAIGKRVADSKVLGLVARFLRAPVVEKGVQVQTKKGTPQGGVLSPLLANILLNEFDQYWYEHWGRMTNAQRKRQRRQGKANCVLFRYADDFILVAKGTREQVVLVMDSIRSFFTEKLRLNLSTEKTRVVQLEEGIDFLGFHIQLVQLDYGRCVRIGPTQKNQLRLRYKLLAMLGPYSCADDPLAKIMSLNRVRRGWANY